MVKPIHKHPENSVVQLELRDSLEPLFPDSAVRRNPCRLTELDLARGGTAAVHILITGLKEGVKLRLAVRGASGPVHSARWWRLVDVPVEANTGPIMCVEGTLKKPYLVPWQAWLADPIRYARRTLKKRDINSYVIRRAPFRVYDAMEPVAGALTASAATVALRLHVPVPYDARPGRRKYEIGVRIGGEARTLRLAARVHDKTVPAAGPNSFTYTNWFSYENIAERHNLRIWSPAYWRMLRRYADLMHHARQNAFWIPWEHIFTLRQAGPVLNRARLRRIVKTFTAAGLHWIESGHVAVRTGGKWLSPTFDLKLSPGVLATSSAGLATLAGCLRELDAEIERNGWRARWLQHVADEPVEENAADYRILAHTVRKHMPGAVILDAVMASDLAGSVDIWCPLVHEFQQHRRTFELQRADGDRIWCYTCLRPGGRWLNRLLDGELLRPALLGWAMAFFRLDGFLHWGFNHYQKDQDPFRQSVVCQAGGPSVLPAGDTHIVYPGKDAPWSSLRLESHREGFEDLELLTHLRSKNLRIARRIARMAVRGFDRYVKGARRFREARRALLEA
ncbi:MAG: hypothetical protein C0404_08285 [Verrucomicrobia bacterium]|nr:hypothetical protein [Verrucomicrobiota bacterium]